MQDIEERVICFKKDAVGKKLAEGVFPDTHIWNPILSNAVSMSRNVAEQDRNYKQLVVYVLVKSNNSYLVYDRTQKSAETRLWDKFSLGIGGHVNVKDDKELALFCSSEKEALAKLANDAKRELGEEIIIDIDFDKSEPRFTHCFVNDDSDEVGTLHFGLIWLLKVEKKAVVRGRKGLAKLEFCDIDTIQTKRSQYESWSQMIIDSLCGGNTCEGLR